MRVRQLLKALAKCLRESNVDDPLVFLATSHRASQNPVYYTLEKASLEVLKPRGVMDLVHPDEELTEDYRGVVVLWDEKGQDDE